MYANKTPDANDCPSDEYRIVSEKIDELKSVAGIKPKVVQDLTSIMEKFPCYNRVLEYLKRFVSNFFMIMNVSVLFLLFFSVLG